MPGRAVERLLQRLFARMGVGLIPQPEEDGGGNDRAQQDDRPLIELSESILRVNHPFQDGMFRNNVRRELGGEEHQGVVRHVKQDAREQATRLDRQISDHQPQDRGQDRLLKNRMTDPEEKAADDDRSPLVPHATQAREDEAAEGKLFANWRDDRHEQQPGPGDFASHALQFRDHLLVDRVDLHHQRLQRQNDRVQRHGQQKRRRNRGPSWQSKKQRLTRAAAASIRC